MGAVARGMPQSTRRSHNMSSYLLDTTLVAQFEFVEWTDDAHLRHSRFVALREDKKAKGVKRES